ncbi:hypothetical protein TRFO_40424 [Tritrichomonas foetus]|uniref:Arf-GAP domain-containing protein n=1 Tax=Tritrichomonas foetus TaxID=1144522 RepID=A0A1J4J7R2_9EUKA|nr:hypothetical protein TRFO_40424 [Tritrichomonas foetus]|eukprot:OHS93268.1 hypothetical protein TRFO_40424 [Tritrichomonas foetus]
MTTPQQKQHMKIIRGLMNNPANKKCADCGEPVAANVDVTHGIFVCTSCSGIHREFGDRIKSVSMASFTQDEINLLQSQNNDDFNAQWLAKFNKNTDRAISQGASDNQRRQYLIAKYQEKRWYSKGGGGHRSRHPSQPAAAPAPSHHQPAPSNPYNNAPQQNSNPFNNNPFTSQPNQQPQTNPFNSQPAQNASNPFQANPFNNSQPAPAAPQQNQQWSPFAGQAGQPQQQPQQQTYHDDLLDLDFDNPANPQVQRQQQQQAQHNQLRGLVGLIDDAPPATLNGQPNINALRESGLGGNTAPNYNMTMLSMQGFGNMGQMRPFGAFPGAPMGGAPMGGPMGGYPGGPMGGAPMGGMPGAYPAGQMGGMGAPMGGMNQFGGAPGGFNQGGYGQQNPFGGR